ncbi:unnamed protein product, partial [Pylaiella littoralis]
EHISICDTRVSYPGAVAMDADNVNKALVLVQLARDHARCGRHGAATAGLMQALQVVPQLAEELEGELTFSLKAYGEHLAEIEQPSNALWLYSQAIPLLPRPRGLYANLGALQYSVGKAAASIESFQRALALDPGYWPALESLENVKSLAVDRWHFRMLNHSARNEAYSRAIQRAVVAAAAGAASDNHKHNHSSEAGAGVTVLDIGTGTGILAVMAARAGAAHVYACEVNGVLCDIAREVMERNGVADRVTVIHKSSGALKPGLDLPERGVDVIVTELVDSGLLGERIMPVLTDAMARGLLAEGGCVIPEGACVYAAVLESEAVRRRSRLLSGSPAGLSTATACPTIEEPYTCEDLGRLEHQLLTSPTAVLEVDFLRDGAALLAARAAMTTAQQQKTTSSPLPAAAAPAAAPASASAPAPAAAIQKFQLPVDRSGCADAVAVWFDLWLDGERGARDVVSTRPERRISGDASGWDAGIYFASGESLHEGRDVRLEASAGLDRLRFALNGQKGFVADAGSIVADTATKPSEGAGRKGRNDGKGEGNLRTDDSSSSSSSRKVNGSVFVGEMDLARLNDGLHHLAHAHAVARALVARGTEVRVPLRSTPSAPAAAPAPAHAAAPPSPCPPAFILDLCGAWGVAGLLVAQLEHCADGAPATRVLAVAESEEAASVLNAIARENGLGPDRYVATADGLVDLASRGRVAEEAPPAAVAADGASRSYGGGGGGGGGGHIALSGDPALAFDRGSLGGDCCGSGKAWPSRGSGSGWAVVMASSLVEGSGLLKQGGLGDLEVCRRIVTDDSGNNSSVSDGGRTNATSFVPGRLEVVCQGLQRASLLSENRVLSEHCCGVDVDPVNAFSVASFRELDLSAATPCCCSSGSGSSAAAATAAAAAAAAAATEKNSSREGEDITQCNSKNSVGGSNQAAKGRGDNKEEGDDEEVFLTAAVACYDLDLAGLRAGPDGCLERRSASLRVERAGTLHAIAYWYRQSLGSAAVLDTRPAATACSDHRDASSSSPLSHFRQAAVLLHDPIPVTVGQRIDIGSCTSILQARKRPPAG